MTREGRAATAGGPVGQAADEPALLQAGDQAVNPRFGAQVERFLHFLERRRDTGLVQTFVDENQKFVLFLGEHTISTPSKFAVDYAE